jgi:spore maturation protein CgeB
MRIFFASHSNPVALVPSKIWYYNLFLPLQDLGHTVIPFRYDLDGHMHDLSRRRKFRSELENELLQQIAAEHAVQKIDLLFSYFDATLVTPKAIEKIRRMGIATVNWYCNASYQFHKIAPIAPAFDFCLVPEKFRLADYVKIGARPVYCQEAANPAVYQPYQTEQDVAVSFIGQRYGDRPLFIRYLLDHGIDVHVFGAKWQTAEPTQNGLPWHARLLCHTPATLSRAMLDRLAGRSVKPPRVALPASHCHAPLSDTDMVRLFSRSKINLGFSSCGNTAFSQERIQQVRLRDFEVPMSGGFYLTEFMEELQDFFVADKEIVCYRNADELLEKTKYYLEHDGERSAIRQAGHARALRDHTWQHRLQDCFLQMGLS